MCEANAYIIRDGEEELLMEAVDKIEPEDDGLRAPAGEYFRRPEVHSRPYSCPFLCQSQDSPEGITRVRQDIGVRLL